MEVRWETDPLWCQTTEPFVSTINTLGLAYLPPGVIDAILPDHFGRLVIQHRELKSDGLDSIAGLGKVVHADG